MFYMDYNIVLYLWGEFQAVGLWISFVLYLLFEHLYYLTDCNQFYTPTIYGQYLG